MALNTHKLKVWAKLTGISLVVLCVLIFILSNGTTVKVKFLWMETPPVKMYAFIVLVAVGGVVVFWICRGLRRVIAEVRALRREEKSREELASGSQNASLQKGNS
jgi:uncharacterized integral membrane protein